MRLLYQAAMLLLISTLITGVGYPLVVTGLAQLFWAKKSYGSLIEKNNRVVGSELIGQAFKKPNYFWPRPSVSNFDAFPSSASNLSSTSADLKKQIAARRTVLSVSLGVPNTSIPIDLLTTSGSGLDPHISPEAAKIQVTRIITVRGLSEKSRTVIEKLIDEHIERPQFGILGEQRINVLLLNLALDAVVQQNDKMI